MPHVMVDTKAHETRTISVVGTQFYMVKMFRNLASW